MQHLSQSVYARLVTLFDREEGQTMAEYGVVLALITLLVIAALTLLSTNITKTLTNVAGKLG
jgi:pilus assembly protein Flp/PilA